MTGIQQDHVQGLLQHAYNLAQHRSKSKPVTRWDAGMPDKLKHLEVCYTLDDIEEQLGNLVVWPSEDAIRVHQPGGKPVRPADPPLSDGDVLEWRAYPSNPDTYTPVYFDQTANPSSVQSLATWATDVYAPYVRSVKAWQTTNAMYRALLLVAQSLREGQDREQVEMILGCFVLTHRADASSNIATCAESYPLLQWHVEPRVATGGAYIDLDISDTTLDSSIVYFPAAKDVLESFAVKYTKLVNEADKTSAKEYTHLNDEAVNFDDGEAATRVSVHQRIPQQVGQLVADLNNKVVNPSTFSVAPTFVLFTRKLQDPYVRFLKEASSPTMVANWVDGMYPAIYAAVSKPDDGPKADLSKPDYVSDDYLYTRPLTPDQLACVDKALHQPFSAVTGPPGTGKTYVIAATVEAALARGERVLVTSENVTALSVVREQLHKEIQPLSISGAEKSTGASRAAQNQGVLTALTSWEKTSLERLKKESVKSENEFKLAAQAYTEQLRYVHELLGEESYPLGPGTDSRRLESILVDMRSDDALPNVDASTVGIIDNFPLNESEDRYLRDLAERGFNFKDGDLVAQLLLSLESGYTLVDPALLRETRDAIMGMGQAIRDMEKQIADFVAPAFEDVQNDEEPKLVLPKPGAYTPPPLETAVLKEPPLIAVSTTMEAVPIPAEHRDTLNKLHALSDRVLELRQEFPEGKSLRLPGGVQRPERCAFLREIIGSLESAKLASSTWRQVLQDLGALRTENFDLKQQLYDCVVSAAPDRRARKIYTTRLTKVLDTAVLTKQRRKALSANLKPLPLEELRDWFRILCADALAAEILPGWQPLDNTKSLQRGLLFFTGLSDCIDVAEELGIREPATMTPGELGAAVLTMTTDAQKIAEQERQRAHQTLAQEVRDSYQRECEAVAIYNREVSERTDNVNRDKQQLAREAYDKALQWSNEKAKTEHVQALLAWQKRNVAFVQRRQEHIDGALKRFSTPLTAEIGNLRTDMMGLQQQLTTDSIVYEKLPADHTLHSAPMRRAGADEAEYVATLRKQLESLKTLQIRQDPRELWEKLRSSSPSFSQALARKWGDAETVKAEQTVQALWRSSHSSGLIRAQASGAVSDNDWSGLKNAADKLDRARAKLCVARSVEQALPRLQEPSFRLELKSLISALGLMTNTSDSKRSQRVEPVRKRAAIAVSKQIPVLITTTRQALDLFGDDLLQNGSEPPFDMVVVDEASQSPLESVVLLLLGKRVLVVGDDEQNSPTSVGVTETTVRALQNKLPEGTWPAASLLDMGFSLFHWAEMADKTNAIVLREHNRCSPEIIELSNKLVYAAKGKELLPLKPRAKGTKPLVDFPVTEYDIDEDGINVCEVEKVARVVGESISACPTDTIGVILLCGDKDRKPYQTKLMAALLERKIDPGIIKIDSSSGFQGDERDIIVLALCVPNRHADGTPRLIRGWVQKTSGQALNVALSRAKKQLILVRSMNAEDLHENDVRGKLLRFYGTHSAYRATPTLEQLLERCHPGSPFERDVARRLFALSYLFDVNELVTGGRIGWRSYRVDLTFTNDDGQRIGLELDGDRYHTVEQFEADWHRQKRLESAGWTIIRISGRKYFSNPDEAITLLQTKLAALKVLPQTSGTISVT